jgi:hypothetical protein
LRIELREEHAFAPSELVAEAAVTPQNPDGDDVKDASFVARVRRTLIFMYGDNSPFKALLILKKGEHVSSGPMLLKNSKRLRLFEGLPLEGRPIY